MKRQDFCFSATVAQNSEFHLPLTSASVTALGCESWWLMSRYTVHSATSATEGMTPEPKQQKAEDRKLLNHYDMISQGLGVKSLNTLIQILEQLAKWTYTAETRLKISPTEMFAGWSLNVFKWQITAHIPRSTGYCPWSHSATNKLPLLMILRHNKISGYAVKMMWLISRSGKDSGLILSSPLL